MNLKKKIIASTIATLIVGSGVTVKQCNMTATPITVTVTRIWTSTGEHGLIGQATALDMRYANDSTVLKGWTAATKVTVVHTPKMSGQVDSLSFPVTFEDGVPMYFALKTSNKYGIWSPLSNIYKQVVVDSTPPAQVTDLH